MASRIWTSDRRYGLYRGTVDLMAEIPITTAGAVSALSATKNKGIKSVVQASAAAAGAGGELYVLSLTDAYRRCLGLAMTPVGQVPACANVRRIGDQPTGGTAAITMAAAAATDYVTVSIPGAADIVLTAVAYNATPGDNQWCVGNTTGADAESANNLAALINNDAADALQAGKGDSNGNGGSTTMPNTITAWAVGSTVVLRSRLPGVMLKSHSQTKEKIVTDVAHTVDIGRVMQPGFVLGFAVGVTATVPAAGDVYQFVFHMLNEE